VLQCFANFITGTKESAKLLTVSTTNKTDRHDITEILLKVALSTIKQTKQVNNLLFLSFNLFASRIWTSFIFLVQ
jgi:hypothetical protein